MQCKGQRALVTGASSGIGADLARALAARGADLVLTARRRDLLEALASELRVAHGVTVDVVDLDLGAAGSAAALWTAATAGGRVDLLINNAGFGYFRPFGSVDWARDAELLQLNIVALVELCHHFVTATLADRRPGRILNVASIAAYQAVPFFASYAASKAYVRDFSEALHYELRSAGVSVTCLAPGGTHTAFHAMAGAGDYGAIARASMQTSAAVAEAGVRGMLRGKKTVIPGIMNKLSCFFVGLAPRGLASRSAMFIMGGKRTGALPGRAGAAEAIGAAPGERGAS